MPVITTASLSNSLPKFIAEAQLTLKQQGVMPKLVKQVRLGRGQGLTYNVPTWGGVSVLALTQGTDLSQAQSVTDSNFAVTVAEVGGQVFFSDLTEMALREDVMRYFGQALGNAYINKVDTDLTAQMANATTTLGGATTTLVVGMLQAAAARLMSAARPVEGTLSCVLHPYSWHAIAQDLSGFTSGAWRFNVGTPSVARGTGGAVMGLTQDIIETYHVAKLAGVDLYLDPNIAIVSSAAKNGMFAQQAICYVQYEDPTARPQRDESLRGVEVNYVGTYGVGFYDGTWGFVLQSDASTPTT